MADQQFAFSLQLSYLPELRDLRSSMSFVPTVVA
jgi:hypothetical protein